MPPRIPDEKRTAILADIKAGKLGNREIARKHDVAPSTVTKIAKDSGQTGAFERSQTENATRAVVADNRSRRAQLASDLLTDAQRFRERAWAPYSYYERGQFGPELVTLDKPPLKDAKEAYVAIGISLQRHAELEKLDSDRGEERAKSMLGQLAEALNVAAGPAPEIR